MIESFLTMFFSNIRFNAVSVSSVPGNGCRQHSSSLQGRQGAAQPMGRVGTHLRSYWSHFLLLRSGRRSYASQQKPLVSNFIAALLIARKVVILVNLIYFNDHSCIDQDALVVTSICPNYSKRYSSYPAPLHHAFINYINYYDLNLKVGNFLVFIQGHDKGLRNFQSLLDLIHSSVKQVSYLPSAIIISAILTQIWYVLPG